MTGTMHFSKARLSLFSCLALPLLAAAPAPLPEFQLAWRLDDTSVILPLHISMDEQVGTYDMAKLPDLGIKSPATLFFQHDFKRIKLAQFSPEKQAALAKLPAPDRWTLLLGGAIRAKALLIEYIVDSDESPGCSDLPIYAHLRISEEDLALYQATKEKYYLALPESMAAALQSLATAGRWESGFKLDVTREAALKETMARELRVAFKKERLENGKLSNDSMYIDGKDPRWPIIMAIDRKILAGQGALLYDVQAFRGKPGAPPVLWLRAKLRLDGYDRILESFWATPAPDGTYRLKPDATKLGDGFYSGPSDNGKLTTEKVGQALNVFSLDNQGGIGVLYGGYGTEGMYFNLLPYQNGALSESDNLYYEGCD